MMMTAAGLWPPWPPSPRRLGELPPAVVQEVLVEVVQHHLDFVIFADLVLVIVVDGEHRPAEVALVGVLA